MEKEKKPIVGIYERGGKKHRISAFDEKLICANQTGYNNSGIDRCKHCRYWSKAHRWCDYLDITGKLRLCKPNNECTVYKPRKRRTPNEVLNG